MPEPLDVATYHFPALHAGQRQVWDSAARHKVLACGRRWGKTRLGTLMCVAAGLQGERAWWVAPSYKVAEVGWRGIRRLASQIPETDQHKVDRSIAFPGGGFVQVRSADDPDSLRGEGLDFVVLDECAFIQEQAWTEALRPALSDRLGKALFISTPKGRNWFWRLWAQGRDEEIEHWHAWRFPTRSNPFIAAEEIEAARRDLPERTFQQEYEAEFLEDAGAVFRSIRPNLYPGDERGPTYHRSHRMVMGVDWGKHLDFTALSVVCADCAMELALERFNRIDYAFQRQRLANLARRWNVELIIAESNAMGEPVIEQLQRDGLPVQAFQTTNASKTQIIEALALALERQTVRWLDDETATLELEAYEMEALPSGRLRYSAPAGMHDDTVIARALANRARSQGALKRAYVF